MAAQAMASAVHLRSAVALAGRFPALSGVDLDVAPGEVVAVLGPNGAGKTSLLRACAGLLAVTSGEVVVLGHDLRDDRTAVRRRVGLLGHDVPLYDELSPAENVRFAVRAAGLGTDRVGPALDRLGLVGRLRRTPAVRLSAGQRRRTALAILVARAPDLWLLDEPHAGLDAGARSLLADVIGAAAAGGAAVVLSSHEPDLAVPLADRVVEMSGGRVVGTRRHADGSPSPRPVLVAVPTGDADVA
jgi:heme ABC exporter ATP-binding subunit CcmA